MARRALIFLLFVPLLLAFKPQPSATLTSSVTLNQPNPVYGDTVTFTEVYPREAQGRGRTPQFPDQPNIQVDCFQGATQVAREGTITIKSTRQNLGGGFYTAQSGPIQLREAQEFTWPPSPASCQVTMYSVEQQNGQPVFRYWATTSFQVAGP